MLETLGSVDPVQSVDRYRLRDPWILLLVSLGIRRSGQVPRPFLMDEIRAVLLLLRDIGIRGTRSSVDPVDGSLSNRSWNMSVDSPSLDRNNLDSYAWAMHVRSTVTTATDQLIEKNHG